MGEIADADWKTNNSSSPAASLSLGEMRAIRDSTKYLGKDREDLTSNPSVVARDPGQGLISEEIPRETTRLSLVSESLTEQEIVDSKADDESEFQGPNAILVQSGNFGTTSTFNFTDSLNEPRGNKVDEEKASDVMDQETMSEERSEISEDIAKDPLQKQSSGDRQPTKIMLMIPSVADEDSYDDVTVEGGEASNDDVSTISL